MDRMPKKKEKSAELTPLVASAKARTSDLVGRLERAMATMAAEIQANDNLYPFNKGRVTQAEVCRRAGVNKVTLQNEIHKKTTRVKVDEWVKKTSSGIFTGRSSIRRAVSERVHLARLAEDGVKTQYHIARIELGDARRRVRELEADVERLKSDNQALADLLKQEGQSKVVPIRKK